MEKEYKDQLKKHLNNVIDNILVAEVKTYKYSITEEERNPRCYVLSTFSMCMATIPITETITVYDSVKKVVEEFKSTEFSNIPNEELKEFYSNNGSKIAAIITLLPGRMLRVSKEENLFAFEEAAKMIEGKGGSMYDKEYVKKLGSSMIDVLTIGITSFFRNNLTVYEIIYHGEEVLDMRLLDMPKEDYKGKLIQCKEFIEVEDD